MAAVSQEVTYTALRDAARVLHLDIFGGFHPDAEDPQTDGAGTVLLFGPHEPGFWQAFTTSPEYLDGGPNPLDRWSKRELNNIAMRFDARAVFPLDKPYAPFFSWALRTGRAWSSPVQLLVHERAGLMVSYRGALLLEKRINLPPTPACPCNTCMEKPCLSACPVGALTDDGYDVNTCHAALQTTAKPCMISGCAVRRACPVSRRYGRVDAQSAFHMKAFHPA